MAASVSASTSRVLRKRLRSQRGLLAALAGVTAVVAAALAGGLGLVGATSQAGLREHLAAQPATALTVQVQTRLAADEQAQTAAATSVLDPITRGLPIVVERSLRTADLAITAIDGEPPVAGQRLVLGVEADLADRTTLLTGAWAEPGAGDGSQTDPVEAIMQDDAARELGLDLGAVITVQGDGGDLSARITGTWSPVDPVAPTWFAEPGPAGGVDPNARSAWGPLLLAEEDLRALPSQPFVRWRAWIDVPAVTPGEATQLARAMRAIPDALDDRDVAVRGMTAAGSAGETLSEATATLGAARVSVLVPLSMLAAISLLAAWQVVRLLAAVRTQETSLLLARGASTRQSALLALVEATTVAPAGAVIGGLVATAALAASASGQSVADTVAATAATTVAVVAGVAATVVAAMAVSAAIEVRGSHARRARAAASGSRRAGLPGVLALLALGAGLTTWQLLRAGSPVARSGEQVTAEPVAIWAPVLVGLVLAVAAFAALRPLSALTASLAARRPGLMPVLPARRVAHRPQVHAAAVLVLALASSAVVLAAGQIGSAAQLRHATQALGAGADVRVVSRSAAVTLPGTIPQSARPLVDATGASAGSSVWRVPLGEGGVGQLTAVPSADLAHVVTTPSDLFDAEGIAAEFAEDPAEAAALPGLDLPQGATELGLTVTARATTDPGGPQFFGSPYRDFTLRAWLAAPDGSLVLTEGATMGTRAEGEWSWEWPDPDDAEASPEPTVSYDPDAHGAGQPVTSELALALPVAEQAWRLVALDVLLGAVISDTVHELSIDEARVDGAGGVSELDLAAAGEWERHTVVGDDAQFATADQLALAWSPPTGDTSASYTVSATARLTPFGADEPLPVVLGSMLATDIGAAAGDEARLVIGGVPIQARVVDVVPAIPGSSYEHAALAPAAATMHALLRTAQTTPRASETWLAVADPAAASTVLTPLVGHGAQILIASDGDGQPLARPAQAMFALTGLIAVALALVGVASVAAALLRSSREEVMVLRALGLSSRDQGRGAALELIGVGVAAIAAGSGSGLLLAWLVAPSLAAATMTSLIPGVPPQLAPDWSYAAMLLTVMAGGLGGLGALLASWSRRLARRTAWREEAR